LIMAEEQRTELLSPANDNGPTAAAQLDQRVLRIAQALGRQLASDMARPVAANDNAVLPPQSGEGASR
jgi:hypothetical protein